PKRRRFPIILLIFALVLVVVIVDGERRRAGTPPPARPALLPDTVPDPRAAAQAPSESTPPDLGVTGPLPANSTAVPRPAPRAMPPQAVTASPVSGPTERRYARTWVNVRAARHPGAAVLWILNPGDAVQVDSLQGGWYRVQVAGREPGYVDGGFLDRVPQPTPE
ncbi:MAG: SH3 domain-containing protein, partial [Gemmatimonadales bacterium]